MRRCVAIAVLQVLGLLVEFGQQFLGLSHLGHAVGAGCISGHSCAISHWVVELHSLKLIRLVNQPVALIFLHKD